MEAGDRRSHGRDRQDTQTSSGTIALIEPNDQSRYREEHGLRIETLALPGEDPAELRVLLDQWYEVYQPASVVECHLLEMAVYDLIRIRRCRRCQEAVEESLIRNTEERWRMEQDDEVKPFEAMLASEPAAAVAELKRFAAGCLWLINCWERLDLLMEREWASSGDDREEMVALASEESNDEVLSREETDRLTHVFWLLAQGDPQEREILAFYAASSRLIEKGNGASTRGLPARSGCRERVRAVMQRVLPPLRLRYETLRVEGNGPTKYDAVDEAIMRDPTRASILRAKRQCEKSFHENYNLLLQMRKGLAAPTDLPGVPVDVTPRKGKRGR